MDKESEKMQVISTMFNICGINLESIRKEIKNFLYDIAVFFIGVPLAVFYMAFIIALAHKLYLWVMCW